MSDFKVRLTSADTDPWEGTYHDLMATNTEAYAMGDIIEALQPGDAIEISSVVIGSSGAQVGAKFTVERL